MDRPWTLASPLCAGDSLVCLGSANVLACFDINDGSPVWSYATEGQNWVQLSAPSLWNDRIVHTFGRNELGMAAFDLSGNLLWSFPAEGLMADPSPSPVWLGDHGLLLSGGGDWAALTGEGDLIQDDWPLNGSQWQYSVMASPAAQGDQFTVAWRDEGVENKDMLTGELLWESDLGTMPVNSLPLTVTMPGYPIEGGLVLSQPLVAGSVVWVGTLGGDLIALEGGTGSYLWSYPSLGPVAGSMALGEDRLYLATLGGMVMALAEGDDL